MGIPYWDIQGTTIVTGQYVRLTADVQSVQGGIWNNVVGQFVYIFAKCIVFFFMLPDVIYVSQLMLDD